MSYSNQALGIQIRLIDLSYSDYNSDYNNTSMTTMQLLEKSAAITALMYSYNTLRDIPFNYTIFAALVSNLQTTLVPLLSETECLWQDSTLFSEAWQQKVFWVLAIGGMAAEGKSCYPWFCAHFSRICLTQRISAWEEIKTCLETVLWSDELDNVGQRLWIDCCSLPRECSSDISS
jgi:hypothetical protein